jgi:hypothetical protein
VRNRESTSAYPARRPNLGHAASRRHSARRNAPGGDSVRHHQHRNATSAAASCRTDNGSSHDYPHHLPQDRKWWQCGERA